MPAFVPTGQCDGYEGGEVAACMCICPNNHEKDLSAGLSLACDCDRGGLDVRY